MVGHDDVQRQGTPKAIGRDKEYSGYFRIQITLNIAPDRDWIECFKAPSTFKPDEAHPKLAEIRGETIEYRFSEQKLEEKIKWVDKYINQANECYRRKTAKKELETRRQEEHAKKEKEKLKEINRKLKEL